MIPKVINAVMNNKNKCFITNNILVGLFLMDKGKYNNLLNYNDLFKIINQLIILNDYISTSYIVLIVINIENHLIGS